MTSKIEWTEETWNPTLGCERVSAGCDGCYAIRQARMRAGNPNTKIADAYAGLVETRDGRLDWTGVVRALPDRLPAPLGVRRPTRWFVDSMSDLFHDDVAAEYIARVFAIMALAQQHTFQILTKRHARMRSLLSSDRFETAVGAVLVGYRDHPGGAPWSVTRRIDSGLPRPERWPLPNVWLGVSVEDQQWADIRIPALLETPAAVRWISAEPLLGPVDLRRWLSPQPAWGPEYPEPTSKTGLLVQDLVQPPGLDWVVVGGESGPGARPMHPDWARSLRDQCAAATVPVLFKQWGDWAPNGQRGIGNIHPDRERLVGAPLDDMGHRAVIERVGKKAAGRVLDGVVHDDYPVPVSR